MLKAIKQLIDNGIINEETRDVINESWEEQINEARETVRTELREEFARRYEHDKSVMVEALDKMITEQMAIEVEEFRAERQALAEDRVKAKHRMVETAHGFNDFLVTTLAEEIKALRKERAMHTEAIQRMEKFVTQQLAEEIKDFAKDKRAVVETKVKLVAEAKQKLAKLQEQFVKRSAKLVKESVTQNLGNELYQLREDIQIARENMFGRKLFEAFATEFSVTHLNESKEFNKLQQTIKHQEKLIAEATKVMNKNTMLVENKNREIQQIKESLTRKEKLNELLGSLNKEKASVMADLLEGVQTEKLETVYEKYLPAVLNNAQAKRSEKKMLAESRVAVTGDKSAKSEELDTNVFELRRLAGLK